MYAIKKILITTDFSDYSAAALDYAISLADTASAELYLLHVVENSRKQSTTLEDHARKNMRKFVYENVNEFTCISQVVLSGDPWKEIVRYAQQQHIDVVVIATHGRTGLAHAMMGSIAEQVIRHSTIPVLAVKPAAVIEQLITEKDILNELHIDGK